MPPRPRSILVTFPAKYRSPFAPCVLSFSIVGIRINSPAAASNRADLGAPRARDAAVQAGFTAAAASPDVDVE